MKNVTDRWDTMSLTGEEQGIRWIRQHQQFVIIQKQPLMHNERKNI